MNKNDILDDLSQYSVEQLYMAIKDGIVTMDEMKGTGNLTRDIRKQLEDKIANAEEEDWKQACEENTEEAYQKYLDCYQQGTHRNEAREAKKRIAETKKKKAEETKQEEIKAKNAQSRARYTARIGIEDLKEDIKGLGFKEMANLIVERLDNDNLEIDDLLDEIDRDKNFLNSTVVNMLVDAQKLDYDELKELNIDEAFIRSLALDEQPTVISSPVRLQSFARQQTTEIYFWGMPSSGKTCTIGAILSAARAGNIAQTMIPYTGCQGYDYMTKLPQCFNKDKVRALPQGTNTDATFELSFDLTDEKDRVHPLTIIDFAGELLRIIYDKAAKKDINKDDAAVLQTLTNVLIDNRTASSKMHFFVIEYNTEGREYRELQQVDLLTAAVNYIDEQNIFKTSTDAIFLLVTKADKIRGANKQEQLNNYVHTNYRAFFNRFEEHL